VSQPADYDDWEADDARRKKACEERGLVVVKPKPDELFVDVDSFEALGVCAVHVERLKTLVVSSKRTPSPSGKPGRFHVVVKLSRPVKDDFERISLQALLGSDVTRELLSWLRASAGVADPTVFFEKAEGGVP
jgi:hypothetical protein